MKNSAAKAHKKPCYTIEPWEYVLRQEIWAIEAYSPLTGQREIVAEIPSASGFPAEATAEFIVYAVNTMQQQKRLISEMTLALEMCLECEGLTWSAELDAEIVLRRAKAFPSGQ